MFSKIKSYFNIFNKIQCHFLTRKATKLRLEIIDIENFLLSEKDISLSVKLDFIVDLNNLKTKFIDTWSKLEKLDPSTPHLDSI